jgi:hypothetical protein
MTRAPAQGKGRRRRRPAPASDVHQKSAAERDWLHVGLTPAPDVTFTSSPDQASLRPTVIEAEAVSLTFRLRVDPSYFDVRANVEAALRRLPLRKDGAEEARLEEWSGRLAMLVLHPARTTSPNHKAARKAAVALAGAWRNLPPDVRSREISQLVLTLGDTSIEHQLALAGALPATFERVAQDMRDLVQRRRPVDESRERWLAISLASVYWDLVGGHPSTSGHFSTPFTRLVEEVFGLANLEGFAGHARAAAERCRKTLPVN